MYVQVFDFLLVDIHTLYEFVCVTCIQAFQDIWANECLQNVVEQ